MVKSKDKKIDEQPVPDGLDQVINVKNGSMTLRECLTSKDWWVLKKGKYQVTILTHAAVKRLADDAGINKNPEYKVLISPDYNNNYTTAIQVTITDSSGLVTTDIGETNRSNLGSRGRVNPINMAQKRGYDRAVLTHLGITGLLGEDELQDPEEEKEMDNLNDDEKKVIVPLINEILAIKSSKECSAFNLKMKKESVNYSDKQLIALRGLFKKKVSEFAKSF